MKFSVLCLTKHYQWLVKYKSIKSIETLKLDGNNVKKFNTG